jgi:hypothetical protein
MRSGIVAASVLIVSLVYIYYLEVKGDNDLHLYGKTTRGIVLRNGMILQGRRQIG